MTERDRFPLRASRRSLLRAGTLASSAMMVGLAGCNAGAGNGDQVTDTENEPAGAETVLPGEESDPATGKALMFADAFHPGARFRVISPVIAEEPDVGAVEEKNIWTGADTRVIEYLNTNERVLFFPVEDAQVEQGSVYTFSSQDLSVYSDSEGIVSVKYDLSPEGDAGERGTDDLPVVGDGGSALVWLDAYYGGGLFRVTSDVVDWTPSEVVQEATSETSYSTRFATYFNSNEEFLFFPADSATVTRGGVYVMHEDFTITDRDAGLVDITFDRVDEEKLPDGVTRTTNSSRRDSD